MRIPGTTIALLVLLVVPTQAQTQRVGTVDFATSCHAAVQPDFNRAVALLHSFAFSAASERFNVVLRGDPRCAMAWWGLALTAWANPFAAGIKSAEQIQRGLDAVTRARSTGRPTARESRYIEAAARLYEHADSVPQRARLLSYRDAMAALAAGEPDDTEAAIFHALALAISADPADKTYASQLAAGATLERLSATLPDHPGLAHYIIHSYDVPPLAGRALGAAARYARIAPAISHALHMPSHTYTRVGDWRRSIDANVTSAKAARREGATAEQLHSADYRTYAYLQLGQDVAARRILTALPRRRPAPRSQGDRDRWIARRRVLRHRGDPRALRAGAGRLGRRGPARAAAQSGALRRCGDLVCPGARRGAQWGYRGRADRHRRAPGHPRAAGTVTRGLLERADRDPARRRGSLACVRPRKEGRGIGRDARGG